MSLGCQERKVLKALRKGAKKGPELWRIVFPGKRRSFSYVFPILNSLLRKKLIRCNGCGNYTLLIANCNRIWRTHEDFNRY